MKRQIAATALTLTILGGGFAFAAPANAAPASKAEIAAVDKNIKVNKEKLRILKLGVSTDKTVGNASDKKARAHHFAAAKNFDATTKAHCSARGANVVFNAIAYSKSANTSAYKNMKKAISYDIKKLNYQRDVHWALVNSHYKLGSAYEKDGIVFKYQKTNPAYDYVSKPCSIPYTLQAKNTLAKYSKFMSAADKASLNSQIKGAQGLADNSKMEALGDQHTLKLEIIAKDNSIKMNIHKLEKKVKSLETSKKNLLAKK